MKAGPDRRALAGWLACALVASLAVEVRAEVGATVGVEQASGWYMLNILDDPDPTSSRSWRQVTPSGPSRVALNPEGEANGDGQPSLLWSTAHARPVAAWAKNSPTGFDVVVSHFDDGAWSLPVVVAGSVHDELDPFLAEDPVTGVVHLVYWIHDGAPRVVHRQATTDLGVWSAATQISAPGEIACRPSIVVHNGTLKVAYESHGTTMGSSPRDIVLATSLDGLVTAEIIASTSFAEANWPQVHRSVNKLWIDWIDAAGSMSWTRQPDGGGWDPIADEPFTTPDEIDYQVRPQIRQQATQ